MKPIENIQLKRDVVFKDVEKLAADILINAPAKIQIPNTLSYAGGFGMEGAALQLLATWFRVSPKHILHTAIQELKADSFEDLCNSLFGLCAIRLSDEVLLAGKKPVSLENALKPAVPIFENIRSEKFKEAFKGMYLTVPAIKSPTKKGGKDREFDSPLYNNEEVIGSQKFNKLTRKALEAIYPKSKDIEPEIISHMSEILRELFTNTHRHARSDVLGNSYAKNFRGIIFNTLSVDAQRFDEIARSGGGNLALFLGDWRPKAGKQFRAIDITVVDSGPGYARRWHKLDKDKLTIDLEKEAIIACFTKHKSTDAFQSSGSGLTNVLSDLKQLRGWFRLRTGRTLVEKSFFNKLGSNTLEYRDIHKMDTFMEGVVFNVVIPLDSLFGAQ